MLNYSSFDARVRVLVKNLDPGRAHHTRTKSITAPTRAALEYTCCVFIQPSQMILGHIDHGESRSVVRFITTSLLHRLAREKMAQK